MFLTVRQISEKHPCFSESSLRFLLFNRKTNGLQKVIRTVGRKILICESDFLNWVNSQNQGGRNHG